MLARLPFVLLLSLAAPAAAQTRASVPAPASAPAPSRTSLALQMLAGSWALRVDGAIVFRFDLVSDGSGWSGSWARPGSFITDGASFASLSGPAAEQKAQSGRVAGDWVELNFVDQRPGALPDTFRFHLVSPDRAELIYADTGLAPFALERVTPDIAPGPWEPGRVYRLAGVAPGPPVRFNMAPVVVGQGIAPRRAPAETQGPPAIEGR